MGTGERESHTASLSSAQKRGPSLIAIIAFLCVKVCLFEAHTHTKVATDAVRVSMRVCVRGFGGEVVLSVAIGSAVCLPEATHLHLRSFECVCVCVNEHHPQYHQCHRHCSCHFLALCVNRVAAFGCLLQAVMRRPICRLIRR